jgi:hypothetical protein
MAAGRRYDIYRVFEVSESAVVLRIAEGTHEIVGPTLAAFNKLPPGVQVDGVLVDVGALKFGPAVNLAPPTPEEADQVE